MPRTECLAVAVLLCAMGALPAEVAAASRGGHGLSGGRGATARPVVARHAGVPPRRWVAEQRRLRRAGAFLPLASYYGPAFDYGPAGVVAIAPPIVATLPPEEANSFAALPARTGIPYPPRPEPTLYRIEGPRDRPVTRVIRLSDLELDDARRTRHVHAETGALLLTVPGR
jgi:hypothetical protein